jgi:peroxiredoxin (alkyl hydroperoxide reductase subunit C)
MVSIGDKYPEFNKKACVSIEKGNEFKEIRFGKEGKGGKWLVMFWYPKDFTFICPVEIKEFNDLYEEFAERETLLYGASTDSEYSHLAWRKQHDDLKDLKFPLIADTSKSLAEALGILEADERVAYRVTFIVDPEGIIRWVCASDMDVGRNVAEVIRILDALQNQS